MTEAINTNDIVIEDFEDTYLNLTLKSTFMLKWMLDQCSDAKFVMKVDDDMFVHPANLWATLQSTELNSIQLNQNSNNLNYALIGRQVTEVIPVRKGLNLGGGKSLPNIYFLQICYASKFFFKKVKLPHFPPL